MKISRMSIIFHQSIKYLESFVPLSVKQRSLQPRNVVSAAGCTFHYERVSHSYMYFDILVRRYIELHVHLVHLIM